MCVFTSHAKNGLCAYSLHAKSGLPTKRGQTQGPLLVLASVLDLSSLKTNDSTQ